MTPSVVLPDGFPIAGEILTSHVRSIDTLARLVATTGLRVSATVLAEVRGKPGALLGL